VCHSFRVNILIFSWVTACLWWSSSPICSCAFSWNSFLHLAWNNCVLLCSYILLGTIVFFSVLQFIRSLQVTWGQQITSWCAWPWQLEVTYVRLGLGYRPSSFKEILGSHSPNLWSPIRSFRQWGSMWWGKVNGLLFLNNLYWTYLYTFHNHNNAPLAYMLEQQ